LGRQGPHRHVDERRRHAVALLAVRLRDPDGHGHHEAKLAGADRLTAQAQEVVQALGDRRDHDVVDRSAELRADLAQPVERHVRHREPAVRTDLHVEGAIRTATQTGDHARAGHGLGDGLDGARRSAHDRADALEGVAHRLLEGAGDQFGGSGAGSGAQGSGSPSGAPAVEVEQRRADRHAGDPVRHRVVQLHEDGRSAPSPSPRRRRTPTGASPVERSREDAADGVGQLAVTAGLGQRRAAEVELQVEPLVVHPHGPAQAARHLERPLAQARGEVDP
jgi:hypothetical protein